MSNCLISLSIPKSKGLYWACTSGAILEYFPLHHQTHSFVYHPNHYDAHLNQCHGTKYWLIFRLSEHHIGAVAGNSEKHRKCSCQRYFLHWHFEVTKIAHFAKLIKAKLISEGMIWLSLLFQQEIMQQIQLDKVLWKIRTWNKYILMKTEMSLSVWNPQALELRVKWIKTKCTRIQVWCFIWFRKSISASKFSYNLFKNNSLP